MLLGYVFGYKQIIQDENIIDISIMRGVSDDYPNDFEKNKDFWCFAVESGDYSPLYADDHVLSATFDYELKEDTRYWTTLYNESPEYQALDLPTYLVCHALASVQSSCMLSNLRIEDSQYIELLKPHNIKLDTFKKYLNISALVYEAEIERMKEFEY